ncbi:MAG TPA: hypothetical protein VII43_09375 [Opitutaceae bacterium]
MRSQGEGIGPGVSLGVMWSLWHLPVIDYLGTASPHGVYLLPFPFAFALAMTAMRVLIALVYTRTNSVFLAQLMHVSSTGSLVVFGAWLADAAQETVWYALYGLGLWLVTLIFRKTIARRRFRREPD